MRYIVNNQEVEYLHIEQKKDKIIVHFEEKFNLTTAHHGVIMQKLRDNRLHGIQVFTGDIQHHNIIEIWLKDENQLHGVLHALSIPHACYEFIKEDLILVIDVPDYLHGLEIENRIAQYDWEVGIV